MAGIAGIVGKEETPTDEAQLPIVPVLSPACIQVCVLSVLKHVNIFISLPTIHLLM
jgi:hypothetical protein